MKKRVSVEELQVKGIPHQITLIRSDRKSISVGFDGNAVVARVPYSLPEKDVVEFLLSRANDIERAFAKYNETTPDVLLTQEEIRDLAERAMKYIPERVKYYASLIGVVPSKLTIRNQKTKWGSCSDKGSLNFNCLLMLTPPEVIDAVVVHELCHIKHMNHSKEFYAEVRKAYPKYDKWNLWLKEHGNKIMRRMTG